MSPTAGIKSGIKGCSLCSISIVLGVYLEKNTTTALVTRNCAAIVDTKESQEQAKPFHSPLDVFKEIFDFRRHLQVVKICWIEVTGKRKRVVGKD